MGCLEHTLFALDLLIFGDGYLVQIPITKLLANYVKVPIQLRAFPWVGVNTIIKPDPRVKLASTLGKSRIQKKSGADNLFLKNGLVLDRLLEISKNESKIKKASNKNCINTLEKV